MPECSFKAVEPRRLPLVPERPHKQPPRIAECANEQIYPNRLVTDRHPHLTKIDLQLFARRRLKPHACPCLSTQRLAQRRCCSLDGSQRYLDAMFSCQILTHHVAVAAMSSEPLVYPVFETLELTPASRSPVRNPATRF
jgi:hypothetical protein